MLENIVVTKKLFRYRRPSLSTLLGITKMKRKIKRESGYYAMTKPLRFQQNLKRRIKRRMGYYSEPMKALRAKSLYFGPFKIAGKRKQRK